MCTRNRFATITVILLAFHAGAGVASAQPRVTASVSSRLVYANQPFTLTVSVNGADQVQPPQIPALDNFQAESRGSSQKINIINGRRATSRSFTFMCQISTVGDYTIGGIEVVADGKTLSAPLVTVTVREAPDPSDRLFVEIRTLRETAYVGQEIDVTLAFGVKPPLIGGRQLDAETVLGYVYDSRPLLGPFPKPATYRVERRKVPSGEMVEFYVYLANMKLIATETGPLTFDDVLIRMTYPTRFRRDLFENFRIAAGDPLSATPKPSSLIVKPLPDDNQPPGFNGAVGVFNLTAKANPTEVRIGDPIEVQLILRGSGPLEQILPPDFKSSENLQRDFRISDEPVGARFDPESNQKIFSMVIRARDPNVTEIPSFVFPYFDADDGAYRKARSEAIPLRVSDVETLDLAAIEGLDTERRSEHHTERLDGLRGNITTETTLLATHGSVSMTGLVLSQTAPAALFLLGWTAASLRKRANGDSARKRRAKAASSARSTLQAADRESPGCAAQAVLAAMSGYFADRLNAPAERYHGVEAEAALQSMDAPEALCQEVLDLIQRCESAAYAGLAGEPGHNLIAAAEQLIDRLEQHS